MSPSELPKEVEALRRMKISSSHKMSNQKRASRKESYPDSAKAIISQKAKRNLKAIIRVPRCFPKMTEEEFLERIVLFLPIMEMFTVVGITWGYYLQRNETLL